METDATSVRALMMRLVTKSWFLLFAFGAGCSFVLADVYWLLVNYGALANSPVFFYAGEAVAPVSFSIYWSTHRNGKGIVFLRRPALFLLPLTAVAFGAIVAAVEIFVPSSVPGAMMHAATFMIGVGTMAVPFVWIECLFSFKGKVAVSVIAAALVIGGFIQLILAISYTEYLVLSLLVVLAMTMVAYRMTVKLMDEDSFVPDNSDLLQVGGRDQNPFGMSSMIFLFAFAHFSMFSSVQIFESSAVNMTFQLFSFLGIVFSCLIGQWLMTCGASRSDRAHKTLYIVVLIMVVLFLCGFLLGEHAAATLPLYTAKKLIFLLVFVNAFSMSSAYKRAKTFALSMSLLVAAWFAYYGLRFIVGMLDFRVQDALGLAAMIAIIAVTVGVLVSLAAEGVSPVEDNDILQSKAAEEFAARCVEIGRHYGLTARENELFPYLASGFGANYIAEELTISPATVRTHAHNIYAKMNVSSQHELIELLAKR